MSSNYYPAMVVGMTSLEPALQPPYAMGEYDPDGTFWRIQNNVALPVNAGVLAVYKELQRQINRILAKMGASPIGVDGRIGAGTAGGLLRALRWARAQGHAPPIPVSQYVVNNQAIPVTTIARYGDEIAAATSQIASRVQAMPVPDPPQSKPSQPAAGGGVAHPPPAVIAASASPSFIDNLGVPRPVAYAALAVGALALYKATQKKGGGRRRRR